MMTQRKSNLYFITILVFGPHATTAWLTLHLTTDLPKVKMAFSPTELVGYKESDRRRIISYSSIKSCMKSSSNNDDEPQQSTEPDEINSIGMPMEQPMFFSDCNDEEECEIDWDAMPFVDFGSEDATSKSTSTEEYEDFVTGTISTNTGFDETQLFDSDDDESEDFEDVELDEQTKIELADQLRTRFEMQWQMSKQSDDCDVYKPVSCGGKPCESCDGQGHRPCRFCRGTGFIYMQLPSASIEPRSMGEQLKAQYEESVFGGNLNSLLQQEPSSLYVSCNVCNQKRHETCRDCQGSGWIAEWTSVNIHSRLNP